MSWREKLRVDPSNAEIELWIELQRRGLHRRMMARGTAILFMDDQAQIVQPERLTKQMVEQSQGYTVPDFPFLHDRLPCYLDGPVHLRRGVKNRDDRIDRKLRRHGYDPRRFSHTGRLGQKRTQEIVEQIKQALQK